MSPVTWEDVLAKLSTYRRSLLKYWRQSPIVAVSAIALIPIIAYIIPSYRGYLELGRGGLPYNFFGWSIQALIRPFSRGNTRDSRLFKDPKTFPKYGAHGRTRFIKAGSLGFRRGERPVVPSYVAPQRQVSDKGGTELIAEMNDYLANLASRRPELLSIRPSQLEASDCESLWINSCPPSYLAASTKGEIVHVHPEASSHIILSLADAEEATTKGWSERHRLSGVMLPLGYVLVYAPRNIAEVEEWKELVDASVAFTTAEAI